MLLFMTIAVQLTAPTRPISCSAAYPGSSVQVSARMPINDSGVAHGASALAAATTVSGRQPIGAYMRAGQGRQAAYLAEGDYRHRGDSAPMLSRPGEAVVRQCAVQKMVAWFCTVGRFMTEHLLDSGLRSLGVQLDRSARVCTCICITPPSADGQRTSRDRPDDPRREPV